MRPEGARAVKPRDAATIILVRRDAAKPRVLMGKRNSGHDFMPNLWVFPGGRIDRADFRA
ncbi:MAG: NUDIX hydrolase, partial [Phenylobacterium sp.]|nr:NUDIX hydrolase [Phenylobacterium sp.]